MSFDVNELMKNFEQMQSRMGDMEKTLGQQKVEADAGGGLVRAVVNGRMELLSIHISPKAADPADVGMLEDLVVTAVNRALAKAKEEAASQMAGGLMGGGGFGGLPGL